MRTKLVVLVLLALVVLTLSACKGPAGPSQSPPSVPIGDKPVFSTPPADQRQWLVLAAFGVRLHDNTEFGAILPPGGPSAPANIDLVWATWSPVGGRVYRQKWTLTRNSQFDSGGDTIQAITTGNSEQYAHGTQFNVPAGSYLFKVEIWDMTSPSAQGFTTGEGYSTREEGFTVR